MILYVDETENDEYYIVASLMVKSEKDVRLAFRQFKNIISNFSISQKTKQKIFIEFKSTLLDTRFQKIKKILLKSIVPISEGIYYAYYKKTNSILKERQKELIYISLLFEIANNINYPIDIVFDKFGNKNFEASIIEKISNLENVLSINPIDSQNSVGLKFVDNICSIIRLHLSNQDSYNFYKIIKNIVKKIDKKI